jgi:hypothetical protein
MMIHIHSHILLQPDDPVVRLIMAKLEGVASREDSIMVEMTKIRDQVTALRDMAEGILAQINAAPGCEQTQEALAEPQGGEQEPSGEQPQDGEQKPAEPAPDPEAGEPLPDPATPISAMPSGLTTDA